MSSRRFNSNKVGSTNYSDTGSEEVIRLGNMAVPDTSDFLARISPPVVNQPRAFTDMLDPTSRALMSGITTAHTNGASLQETIRQEARQLQQTVHERFISLNKGNMTYKELLKGLIHEDETLQTWSNFTFLNYTHLRFCDESDRTANQRSGGICLLTDKRLLFLSSQLAAATSLAPWGDPKNLPGGYSIQTTFHDTTYYLPIPLRCFRSIEMSGHTGLQGEVKVQGVAPCCYGLFELCASCCCPGSNLMGQWSSQPANHSHVQEMEVTVGVLMPPWGQKMFVRIHVDPNVPLPVTRDFIALHDPTPFQLVHVPQLQDSVRKWSFENSSVFFRETSYIKRRM